MRICLAPDIDPCGTPDLNYCSPVSFCQPSVRLGFTCTCPHGYQDHSDDLDNAPGESCVRTSSRNCVTAQTSALKEQGLELSKILFIYLFIYYYLFICLFVCFFLSFFLSFFLYFLIY